MSEPIQDRIKNLIENINGIIDTLSRAKECAEKGDVPRSYALAKFRAFECMEDIYENMFPSVLQDFESFFKVDKGVRDDEVKTPESIKPVPRPEEREDSPNATEKTPQDPLFLPLFALRFKNSKPIPGTALCQDCRGKMTEKQIKDETLATHGKQWDRQGFKQANGHGLKCQNCDRGDQS